MPLQNVYYERVSPGRDTRMLPPSTISTQPRPVAQTDRQKIGTERPCYVCNRPTTTVLATIKAEDFIYTCESHLSDPCV